MWPRRHTCARIVECAVSCPPPLMTLDLPAPNGKRAFFCLKSAPSANVVRTSDPVLLWLDLRPLYNFSPPCFLSSNIGAELCRRLRNWQRSGSHVVLFERWLGKRGDHRLIEYGDHWFWSARRSKQTVPVVCYDIRKPLLAGEHRHRRPPMRHVRNQPLGFEIAQR